MPEYSRRKTKVETAFKGNVTEIEIPYFVFGVADESAALAAAKPKVKSVRGMALESIETVERINGTTWKVKAVYEADEGGGESDTDAGEEGQPMFAFDTGNAPAPQASGCPNERSE